MPDLIEKFRMKVDSKGENSRGNYLKAINCLETFMGTYPYSSAFPSEQTLADWFLNMRSQGLSLKTSIHYYDLISALYNETFPGTENSGVFGSFKARIKEMPFTDNPIDGKCFNKILSITKAASSPGGNASLGADIFLYSILRKGMPPGEVALVKMAEIDNEEETMAVLAARYASSRRKYLFPLSQSSHTARQLSRLAETLVAGMLADHGVPVVISVDNTMRLIWACAALQCGIPGSEIIALLGSSVSGIPEMALCSSAHLDRVRESALEKAVTRMFADNPCRWYAMKLRSRVDFIEVEERVSSLSAKMARPEFFYPYEEIRKRVGKKLVKDRRPVIKDIVFFRLRVTDIFPLFCRIGDMAWCYTTTGRPGGDYAPISRREFERFQETIGQFTPDYEIAPIGGFEPEEGETVVVLNGPLANHPLEIEKIRNSGNVIFQLNMVGDNGFQWRTKVRRQQLRPVEGQ